MLCLPDDRGFHKRTRFALNEFDKEFAHFDLVGIKSQETSGLGLGDSEESQTEVAIGVQRKELDNLYDEVDTHTGDRGRDPLRVLCQALATQQDTAASSSATQTELSVTSGAPAFPVRADGSIAPNESRLIQG